MSEQGNRETVRKTGLIAALLISIVGLGLLGSCPSAGAGAGIGGTDDATAKEILRALGVDAVDNPPDLTTTNTQGEEVTIDDPDEWQPLKKTYTVYNPKAEVALVGMKASSSSSYYNSVLGLGNGSNTVETTLITDDQSWEKTTYKLSCAADLDGDGIDEIVLLYYLSGALYLRVYDYGEGTLSDALEVEDITPVLSFTLDSATETFCKTNSAFCQYTHLCPADVDGDGKDELVFSDVNVVYILETDASGSAADVLESKTYSSGTFVSDVAAGDTDGDGADEIIVCTATGGFGYYDSSLADPITNPELVSDADALFLQACAGDFDGDGVDEFAICSIRSSQKILISVYQTEVDTGNFEAANTISRSFAGDYYTGHPQALDMDGDGCKDLYVDQRVYTAPQDGDDADYTLSSFLHYSGRILEEGVGDVDGDGLEDLVIREGYADSDLTAGLVVYAVGLNSSGGLATKYSYTDFYEISDPLTYTGINTSSGRAVAMAVGNFDKDSPRVKYTGHNLQFTDPAVVAVLASPPYWSAIAEADEAYAGGYTNWETSYGTVTSTSTSNGVELGATVGCTVEYEQEGTIFGIKLAKFKSSVTTNVYLNQNISWTHSVSKSVSYTAVGGEDKVIFACIPMDVYSYEILESPDSDDVGNTLTLQIPRDYQMYSVTRSYFNENNGVVNDIDSTVLAHEYGNPKSYPDDSEMETLIDEYGGYKSSSALPTAQGEDNQASGCTVLDISVEDGMEVTTAIGVSVDASIGGGAGGLSVLANFGFSVGYTGTISTSAGTTFGGTVGYLPTTYYSQAAYSYSSGLFAYPYEDDRDGRQYWIVDYWVK